MAHGLNLVERRNFLRIDVDFPGELILSNGTRLNVHIRDLSGGGVQIQCDAFDSEVVAPHGTSLDGSGRPIQLDLVMSPSGKALKLSCRVIFVRRISCNEYRIGLRYADSLQPDLIELEMFIQRGTKI